MSFHTIYHATIHSQLSTLNSPLSTLMKLILAIIQPSRLEAVKEALANVAVFRLTAAEVQRFGRQKCQSETYRGHALNRNPPRKIQPPITVHEA